MALEKKGRGRKGEGKREGCLALRMYLDMVFFFRTFASVCLCCSFFDVYRSLRTQKSRDVSRPSGVFLLNIFPEFS